jgi:enterochelin esterase-like enzyme
MKPVSALVLLYCFPVLAGAAYPTTLPGAPKGFDVAGAAVAQGKLVEIKYPSSSTGKLRPAVIYTPPGYLQDRRYPVLYLLHGAGTDQTGWAKGGHVRAILDNLISAGGCVPMIVVMPSGFAVRPGQTIPSTMPARMLQGTGAFEDDLLKDLIPYVESHYAANPDRRDRAIAGLSMGGGQALRIGMGHLETFAWIGGFSSAPVGMPIEGFISDARHVNEKVGLLWLSCGDQDFWMWPNAGIHAMLSEKGINHIWQVDKGGHEWKVWKADLYHLAPLLFRRDSAQRAVR